MKLSPSAKTALETVREKHLAYMIAKANIEAELKRELSIRLETIRNERDSALRYAVQVGVPKTQLGKAIGTSNYKTVQEILGTPPNEVPVNTFGAEKVSVHTISENVFQVSLVDVGDASFNGIAVLSVDANNELSFVDGDLAVVAQIYRNNLLDVVLQSINK
jgi:hypothetical protein